MESRFISWGILITLILIFLVLEFGKIHVG